MSAGRRGPWRRIVALLRAFFTPEPFVPLAEDPGSAPTRGRAGLWSTLAAPEALPVGGDDRRSGPAAPGFFRWLFTPEHLDLDPTPDARARPRPGLFGWLFGSERLDFDAQAGDARRRAPGLLGRVFFLETLGFEPPPDAPAPRVSLLRRFLDFEDIDACVSAGPSEPGERAGPQNRN